MSTVLPVFGVLAALLAVLNVVQVFLGRQVVRPSAGKRPDRQLRAESAAAAVAMAGASCVAFGMAAGGMWPLVGGLVMLVGWLALVLVRRQGAPQP